MKKYLPYILIGVVVAVILGTGFFNAAYAAATSTVVTGETLKTQGMSWANCAPNIIASEDDPNAFDLSKCVAVASYYVIYTPTALILYVAGIILNGAVNYSLDGTVFKADIISNGWTLTRDFANMFFIFILLYIAIATILQLSGYGMKDLLVKIIIIALLVNFSLLICHVIIDASNILALEFYNKMTTKADVVTTTLFGENARNISAVFMAGFNPEKLLSTDSFDKWKANSGTFTAVVCVLLMFLLGSLMNIVGAFVLFAGAVLFVIRVAVLWLIMLLAPLAFLAMVLPATNQYAKQWWDKLFNQAFFAPAFLFLFYLVSKLIAGDQDKHIPGIIQTMFDTLSQKTAGLTGINAFFGSIITVFIFFIIMTVLMIFCLIVAKQMGAYGSGTMMKWGQSAKKWGQGYAGRVGKRYVGRAATAAEGALEKGEGKFAKTLKAVPFLQRGVAGAAQLKKKEVGKYEKQYAGYDAGTLEQLKGKVGTTPEAREAMGKLIIKKRAQEAKKADIGKENKEYEKIEKELPKMEEWNEADKTRKIEIDVALEANRAEMQKNPSEETQKKRRQLLIEKEQIEERIKEINKMREDKKKIEENRARRREIEELEEEVAKAKAEVAKKPKEVSPEKT